MAARARGGWGAEGEGAGRATEELRHVLSLHRAARADRLHRQRHRVCRVAVVAPAGHADVQVPRWAADDHTRYAGVIGAVLLPSMVIAAGRGLSHLTMLCSVDASPADCLCVVLCLCGVCWLCCALCWTAGGCRRWATSRGASRATFIRTSGCHLHLLTRTPLCKGTHRRRSTSTTLPPSIQRWATPGSAGGEPTEAQTAAAHSSAADRAWLWRSAQWSSCRPQPTRK